MSHVVLIADGLAKGGIAKLQDVPEIEVWERTGISREELEQVLPEVDVLIVRSRTQVDKELLKKGTRLKLVIRAGIGLDNVDSDSATDCGVIVMNAPTGNIVTTAEHTLALMFSATRNIPAADASIRAGRWDKKKFQGNELCGKTLGLVGLGNIGRTVAQRAQGLGMRVIGHDPYLSEEKAAKYDIGLVEMDRLLSESDYLSVHVPLTKATHHLINKDSIEKMKKGAYLINCARGGIVDESALLDALNSGKLSGAALDVFEEEPPSENNPLLKCDKVVLTPHLGASTDEAQIQVGFEVAEQLTAFVREGAMKNAINVPNISKELLNLLRAHLQLCERLGSFTAQLASPDKVKQIRIQFEGEWPTQDRSILSLSILKGFLTPMLSTSVNYVNARKLLKERGIRFEESMRESCDDYQCAVTITVEGKETIHCTGTLFGKEEPRIVRVDNFVIDAIPRGHLLFTRNIDQPGVIGQLGSALSDSGVNIARMHLGRDEEKGRAIAVINIDSEISDENLNKIRQIPGMLDARQIEL